MRYFAVAASPSSRRAWIEIDAGKGNAQPEAKVALLAEGVDRNYKARIAAASWNDRLGSREGASEVTGIDRTRLANIELGTINPHPEEVLMLSDTYNAPELQNHFCSHLCPLGIGTISPIELEELERVTLQLISAMKSLPEVKDGIIDIAADGVIDAKEKPRMEQYLEVLDEITNKAQTLKLIYRKQFGKQEV